MSSIIYTPLKHADHDWLNEGDRALKIDEGTHAGKVVRVSISKTETDTDRDGTIDQLNVKFWAALIDETTGEIVKVGGADVKTNAEVHSLSTNAIANNTISLPAFLAEKTDEFIHKTLRTEAGLAAWATIPNA